jgi:hypothetical protein
MLSIRKRHLPLGGILCLLTALLMQPTAFADTPTPTPPGTVAAGTGLRHQVDVKGRDGRSSAPDGATVIISRLLTRAEYSEVQRTGLGPKGCGTFRVARSRIELTPQFTADCPEGAPISAAIDFNDGRPPISATFNPPVEWRRGRAGEAERFVTLIPDQPPTAGTDSPVFPPATGSGATTAAERAPDLSDYTLSAGIGIALVLGALSIALLRRRPG